MPIKEHPEWTKGTNYYPAIDGIAGEARYNERFSSLNHGPKEPIRPDIVKILNLNDKDFDKWFSERKTAAQRLLNDYKLVGEIPNLRACYEDDEKDNYLSSDNSIHDMIDILDDGIKYLDIIKQVRNEQKSK